MLNPFIFGKKSKKKTQFKKTKKCLLKYKFYIYNSYSSFPIFLFYQHETVSGSLTQELAKLLNNYWGKLDVNLIRNLSLSKADHKNEDQHSIIFSTEIDNDSHLKIIGVIADIINKIEKQFSVSILEMFLDPYFISKKNNKLIADNVVDERSSRIIELAIDDIGNQQLSDLSDKNTELRSPKIAINEQNSDKADLLSLSSEDSNIVSINSASIETYSNDSETLSYLENANNDALDYDAQFISNASITIKPELEGGQKYVQSFSISVQPTYNCLNSKEASSSNWNPETRGKINNLLLSYTKHLSKKYFFRSKDQVTESKKYITTDLLNKLNSYTLENFYQHVFGISTTNILGKHRDTTIIQKIGQFFKRHNKTEGTLLLENIVSTLMKIRR